MSIAQIIKYDAFEKVFPEEMKTSLQDHLWLSSYLIQKKDVKQTIRYVVTSPPLKRPGKSIVFYAFATNRTAYGAIQDLEAVFTDWFLETRILPIINPIPMKYFEEPEMLPKNWYSKLSNRGVKIYSHAFTR